MPVLAETESWLTTLQAAGAALGHLWESEGALHFGDWKREWATVREYAGVFEASFRKLWVLAGADRVSFLQGMITADVRSLAPGRGTYAAAVTVQGRVVSDLRVYALEEEIWLDAPTRRADRLREHLAHYIVADDVEFREPEWVPLLAVEGRSVDTVLASLPGFPLELARSLPLHGNVEVVLNKHRLRVAAVTHTGERGYLFIGPPNAFPLLWAQLVHAGARPVGRLALDVLRLEAGIPLAGDDMDESSLIAEADLETAIAYGKGCYLGQEVVERIAARGQVQRKRVGFVCRGSALPERGAKVWHGGHEVGAVTSAGWSPALERGIGFAYVRRECWDPGTTLDSRWPQGRVEVEVVAMPFLELPVKL
ncbi:MAG: hypothetical protein N3C12_14285 [Candidatus Binatia bacterium]|nr:hypothetical protein [Candidatus Binatia bacterium]